MKCYSILFKLFKFFILFSVLTSSTSWAVPSIQQDIELLREYRKQAQLLMNSNKNPEALEAFEKAGKLQESIYRTENDSVLRALQDEFLIAQRNRREQIDAKEQEIAVLKAGNEDIDRENFKMIRNTLFFFGTLIGIAVLLLLNRFRKLAGLKEQLISSEAQVAARQKIIEAGNTEMATKRNLVTGWKEVADNLKTAAPLIMKISNDKQHPLNKTAVQLQNSVLACQAVLATEPTLEPGDRVLTDLNSIIEEVVNQAYYHTTVEFPDFTCTIVKDLEKILPSIEIIPDDIRFVFFNLLSNAFYSVREKRSGAPKGYNPKVTVSTRKLPRFVQVRVRDNGTGILEKDPTKVFEPFFSTKKSNRNAGLGLSESKKIITGIYKGELLIESDPGTGTDFIVRFPTLTIH